MEDDDSTDTGAEVGADADTDTVPDAPFPCPCDEEGDPECLDISVCIDGGEKFCPPGTVACILIRLADIDIGWTGGTTCRDCDGM
jgi:hypothetical protein